MRIFPLIGLLLSTHLAISQTIIFTKQKNNNDNIAIISETGELSYVTNHPRKDSSPIISPDGKTMVFTSERVGWWKIWTYNLESKKFTQLTKRSSPDYGPSWSPDGENILFNSERDGNQEIYIMTKDGADKQNITRSGNSDVMASWGRDDFIYFSSEVNGTYQIVRCKPDGTAKEVLTKTAGNKLMPQLSNDGRRILYYGDADGNLEVYMLQIDLKTVKRLTNHPLMDMRPRWSPDNKLIVFERGNKRDNHHIFLMSSDGSKVKQLTFSDYNYAPSFLPD